MRELDELDRAGGLDWELVLFGSVGCEIGVVVA